MAARLIEEIEALEPSHYVVLGWWTVSPPTSGLPLPADVSASGEDLTRSSARVRPRGSWSPSRTRRDGLPLQSLLESRFSGIDVTMPLSCTSASRERWRSRRFGELADLSKGFRNHGAAELTARLISVVAAVIGLFIVAPLLALLVLLVKLDSRGPVFFVQQRAGRHGRPFGLLKFRTMHPTEDAPSEWVQDNMHRITRVGRYLRRFRLDELPQLINVLRGEMNLIGPRPHPVSNHTTFMEHIAVHGWDRPCGRASPLGAVRYGYANNLDEETGRCGTTSTTSEPIARGSTSESARGDRHRAVRTGAAQVRIRPPMAAICPACSPELPRQRDRLRCGFLADQGTRSHPMPHQ